MALPFVHRKPPHHAPDCPPSPRLWAVAVHVVSQHLSRMRRHLLHRSRHPLLHWDCNCWDILVSVSVPDTGIDRSQKPQTQRDNQEIFGETFSSKRHLGHPRHLEEYRSGSRFDIPSRLRHRTISIILGYLIVQRSQCVQSGWTPGHRSHALD